MTAQPRALSPANPPTDNLRGGLLLALAAVAFTGEVVAVRYLEGTASQGQIVLARGVAQLAAVGLWAAIWHPAVLRTARPGMHLLRGLTSLLCWWLYYRSFVALDLALATVLTFSTSLFVVVLAGPILGERVGPRRWALTALGFAGVLVASRPSAGMGLQPGVLYGLSAALAAAALIFQNRILARTEPTGTIMLYIALVAVLATAPLAALDWQPLSLRAAGFLALAGGFGTVGMLLTIEAYRVGEVSALAPYPYLRLVFSILAGLILFAEAPAAATLIGSAIIVACALSVGKRG